MPRLKDTGQIIFEKDGCYCVNSVNLGELNLSDFKDYITECDQTPRKVKAVQIDGKVYIQLPDNFLSEEFISKLNNGGL